MTKYKLAPSILSADFGRLADQLREVEEAGAHLIHIDVMDGHFVPNITIGPVVVKAVRRYTKLPLDVHLMIADADAYVDVFAEAGSDLITFHVEAVAEPLALIDKIRALGARPGVAINPSTPADILEPMAGRVDMVTVMSVNPGFGGQSFIPGSLEKIKAVRRLLDATASGVSLEVDGGVTMENAADVVDAGADILVAGSAVFNGDAKAAVGHFLSVFDACEEGHGTRR